MRMFNQISPAIWQSGRFKALSCDGRHLMLYYLTGPHNNSAGCYHIPAGYAVTDLSWESERYTQARQELMRTDMVSFDEDSEVVLIKGWFKHNGPSNPKHRIGTEKLIENLPSEALRQECFHALETMEVRHKRGARAPGESCQSENPSIEVEHPPGSIGYR